MKVVLHITSTPLVERVLAHGPDRADFLHVGPSGLSHSSAINSQVIQPLRSTFSKAVSRANMSTRIQFSVSVSLPDLAQAETYALNYPNTLEREGEGVWFISTVDSVQTIRKLTNVVIESVTTSQNGVNITINYSMVGGQFT